MARKIEILTYTNERGESVAFSHASVYHTNSVSGLSDVRNAIYSINSMGQDGDTYLGNRIESREIEIVGSIRERNKDQMREYRRRLNRVLNPQYAATLTYQYGARPFFRTSQYSFFALIRFGGRKARRGTI